MTMRYVSMYDLMKVEETEKAIVNQDEEAFNKILYKSGFDLNGIFGYRECLHRPWLGETNEPVFGVQVYAEERSDDEWVNSPHCSRERRLESIGKKDPAFQRELATMGQHANFTLSIIEYLKDHYEGKH